MFVVCECFDSVPFDVVVGKFGDVFRNGGFCVSVVCGCPVFFDAYVEWSRCFANVVAPAAAVNVIDYTFGLLFCGGVFPTIGSNDCLDGCGCGEVCVNSCLLLK